MLFRSSDLEVAGFGDFEIAAEIPPGLTTIRTQGYQMGWAAADMLIARIEGKRLETAIRNVAYALVQRVSVTMSGRRPRTHAHPLCRRLLAACLDSKGKSACWQSNVGSWRRLLAHHARKSDRRLCPCRLFERRLPGSRTGQNVCGRIGAA